MPPFEIMVSESQERMLASSSRPSSTDVLAVCEQRGGSMARPSARSPPPAACASSEGTELVGDMPVAALVDDCPAVRHRAEHQPTHAVLSGAAAHAPGLRGLSPARRCWRFCAPALTSPIAGRCSSSTTALVQSRTVRRPGDADAAVLMLPERDGATPGIAVRIDCNGRRVAADPYRGTIEAGSSAPPTSPASARRRSG